MNHPPDHGSRVAHERKNSENDTNPGQIEDRRGPMKAARICNFCGFQPTEAGQGSNRPVTTYTIVPFTLALPSYTL